MIRVPELHLRRIGAAVTATLCMMGAEVIVNETVASYGWADDAPATEAWKQQADLAEASADVTSIRHNEYVRQCRIRESSLRDSLRDDRKRVPGYYDSDLVILKEKKR